MYRVISILLAMVAIAVVFFGISLCDDGTGRCDQVRASRLEGLASQPGQVQRIMVAAGLMAFVGGAIGFLRGPTTLPPWSEGQRLPLAADAGPSSPFLVRGATFLGALFALAGIVLPVLTFVAPAARGLGVPFAVTIVMAVAMAGYFGWHLRGSSPGARTL